MRSVISVSATISYLLFMRLEPGRLVYECPPLSTVTGIAHHAYQVADYASRQPSEQPIQPFGLVLARVQKAANFGAQTLNLISGFFHRRAGFFPVTHIRSKPQQLRETAPHNRSVKPTFIPLRFIHAAYLQR